MNEDRRADKLEAYITKILENQGKQDVLLAKISVDMATIKSRGCGVGQEELEKIKDKIDKVDSKHDKRTIGALGTALLSLAGVFGTFLWKFK